MEMPSSSTANISDIRNAYSRQGLQERSLAEAARLRALKLLGATQQPTSAITRPTLITPTTATSGLRSLLPQRGTPGSAALGAFGQTMSQLGGWQDKPMTFGQILGASLGKAREAYGTAEERQRQIAAEKAAAERQAMLDEYKLRELQVKEAKEKREAGAKPKRESKVVNGALYEKNPETGKWEVAVEKTQDAKTPSSKLFAVNIPGEETMYLRADDPILDDYLGDKGRAIGAVVTEAPKVVGTQSEVTPGLTRAAHAKMVEATFNAQGNIIKLENVNDSFQDEFLTLQGKAKRVWAELKDNLGTSDPNDKAYIQSVTRWKTRAWNQVNDYIKAITGAQMSEAEAKRIMKSLPNPDDSLFAVTSPTRYREALNAAIKDAKMAVARQEYFLKKGLKPEYYETSVPKEDRLGKSGFDVIYRGEDNKIIETYDMPKIMDSYTDKIAAKYETDKYSNLTDDQKIAMINQEVDSYFGLAKTPGQGIQYG